MHGQYNSPLFVDIPPLGARASPLLPLIRPWLVHSRGAVQSCIMKIVPVAAVCSKVRSAIDRCRLSRICCCAVFCGVTSRTSSTAPRSENFWTRRWRRQAASTTKTARRRGSVWRRNELTPDGASTTPSTAGDFYRTPPPGSPVVRKGYVWLGSAAACRSYSNCTIIIISIIIWLFLPNGQKPSG